MTDNPKGATPAEPLTEDERRELLDWISACQSAHHIDSTPGHRFGGLPSQLEENREALCEYVNELLGRRATPAAAAEMAQPAVPEPAALLSVDVDRVAFDILRRHNDSRLWRALTYESGPYDVTMPGLALTQLARAFFDLGVKRAATQAQPAAPEPLESNEWVTQARLTLDRLAAFLQRINAPHAIAWREWIANAEAMVLALHANATQAQPATHAEVLTERQFAEWLNDRRVHDVSSVFHDIMSHYRAALATQAAQTQQPKDAGDALTGPGSTSLRSSDPYRDVRGAE